MKSLLLTLILFPTFLFSQIVPKELKKEIPKELTFKYDKFEQIAWIGSGYQPLGSSLENPNSKLDAELYFGISKDGNLTPLRIKFRYAGNDWIFSEEIIFLCAPAKQIRNDEAEPIRVQLEKNPNNDVLSGGYINEHFDMIVNDDMLQVINYYVNGGQFTATKLKGDEGSIQLATFGKKISKTFKSLYEYYINKS